MASPKPAPQAGPPEPHHSQSPARDRQAKENRGARPPQRHPPRRHATRGGNPHPRAEHSRKPPQDGAAARRGGGERAA
eukprot:10941698-Alexandrium_andersonii.AAC.1